MATQRILLCTDFSENCMPARRKAVEYAKAFGASLAVLHVVDSWAGFPAYEFRIPIDVREVVANIESSAKADIEKLANELRSEVKDVTPYCRVGVPAEEIVNLADEASMDLIVMGTHGWTGFKHFLLGSAAENVLRTANCPVLIVRSLVDDSRTAVP
jgi:universal stress protein A